MTRQFVHEMTRRQVLRQAACGFGSLALAAMVALVHDILMTVGFYAIVGREVNLVTVVAVLTVLGYSLYDTIIIFDRIRENAPTVG
jgi:preprotein translocase subunit SecF